MKDRAETENLEKSLRRIGAALDRFVRFEHPDAIANRAQWEAYLDQPCPQQGVGVDRVVEDICEYLIPNGSAVPRPGFSAYITTGATTVSTLASTAASIASPQRYGLTAFNFLEELSLDWMAEMFGIPHMKGVYSSGGSTANLLALGAARQFAFEAVGVDPALNGVDRPVSVYVSSECHHTIQRSLGVLGVGRAAARMVDTDESGRMLPSELRAAIQSDVEAGRLPMAVVANAGATNTGVIDRLSEIGEIAHEFGTWFHVDGAYGLPGVLDHRLSALFEGLERADSVIVDPHKWLGASVGIAATFVRDRELLLRAFTQEPAAYLEGSMEQGNSEQPVVEHSMDSFGFPYFDYGIELSSPARGVVVWALLREIGIEGMRERIVRHNDMARRLADRVRDHESLELLLEPVLSICCFRYNPAGTADPDALNQRICRQLVRENEFLPSTTRVHGKTAIRPCFVAARAEAQQVDGLIEAVLRIGDSLSGSAQ